MPCSRSILVAAAVAPLLACAARVGSRSSPPAPVDAAVAAQPVRTSAPSLERVARDTARDPLERQITRLEMRGLEKDAQIADLESRLDEARGEVVRALARLQTVANRAEAASGIAEAEIALQALKNTAGPHRVPEAATIASLVKQSSGEFDKQNYGGALYLAGQAKSLVMSARGRLGFGTHMPPKNGETAFALPIRLKVSSAGNARSAPSALSPVAFAIDPSVPLTGYSFVDEWIRVVDRAGRSGWVVRALVTVR
jgi:hypothetical protein